MKKIESLISNEKDLNSSLNKFLKSVNLQMK